MKLLTIITVLFFVFIAFFGNIETSINNPFIAYLFFILKIILEYFPYFLIGFCILFLILIKPYLSKKQLNLKIILHNLFQIFSLLVIGIISSFLILALIAFLELNTFSLILKQNPSFLGVKTNTEDILNAIRSNNIPPHIITNDKDSENEVIAIAKATSGINNFYGSKVLSGFPSLLIFPIKINNNLLFLDNTLVVKKIDENDMQKLSPLIGYLIIKNYFSSRYIKSNPTVTVLNKNSYKNFRKNDVNDKLTKIEIEINKTDSAVSSLSADIKKGRTDITQATESKKTVLKDRDDEYNKCLSAGTYKLNVFTPKNTKEFCQEINKKWEVEFKKSENQEKFLTKVLAENEKLLKEYQFYNSYYKAQKQLINLSTNNITSELGVFEPPYLIKIIVNDSSSNKIADYFESLSHEYLHFTSYTSNKRLESSFFEESLTEYFARQAIKSSLNKDTNLGYPLSVKIIEEISKKISDPELTDIYFNKDQQGLEDKINLVYGDNFYRKNIVLFETLHLTQGSQEALEVANKIMEKIDGDPISEKDIFSKESDI